MPKAAHEKRRAEVDRDNLRQKMADTEAAGHAIVALWEKRNDALTAERDKLRDALIWAKRHNVWSMPAHETINAALAGNGDPITKADLDKARQEMDPDQFKREFYNDPLPISKCCEGCARIDERTREDREMCDRCVQGDKFVRPARKGG